MLPPCTAASTTHAAARRQSMSLACQTPDRRGVVHRASHRSPPRWGDPRRTGPGAPWNKPRVANIGGAPVAKGEVSGRDNREGAAVPPTMTDRRLFIYRHDGAFQPSGSMLADGCLDRNWRQVDRQGSGSIGRFVSRTSRADARDRDRSKREPGRKAGLPRQSLHQAEQENTIPGHVTRIGR